MNLFFSSDSTRKHCMCTVPKEMQGQERTKKAHHSKTQGSRNLAKQDEGEQHRGLGFVAYSRIVEKVTLKIGDNKIYPKEIRDEIESFTNLEDLSAEFSEIQSLHKRLKKSRNAERFNACCYSTIVLNAVKGLTRNAATLFYIYEGRNCL